MSSTTQNLNTGLNGTCTIYKVGGIKQLSIYFTCSAGTLSTLSGNVVTLFSNNRPRTNMVAVASDQNGTLMYVSVNASNGSVRTFGSNLANVTSMTISALYM